MSRPHRQRPHEGRESPLGATCWTECSFIALNRFRSNGQLGNTGIKDNQTKPFGVAYARVMALALLAATPIIIGYFVFQKRVTEAVMISAGVKG